MKFAKLWEQEGEQILVKMDDGEDGPEMRVYFNPAGLGVCNFALKFTHEDIEEAWNKCELAFNGLEEADARRMVDNMQREMRIGKYAPASALGEHDGR